MPHKLLYIITQSPYGSAAGQEALDAILIAASFEQEVSVLFLHDGVFQLKTEQQKGGLKQFTNAYRALSDFGVEHCYVLCSSLVARGVEVTELTIQPTVIDELAASTLISQQYRVFTF